MIITNNEEALRIKCEDVFPEEVAGLVEVLEKELNHANKLGKSGIGLAAPQIGIAKKIAIIRLGREFDINLINAKLDKGYYPSTFVDEGCLSFPGRVETTTRFQEIVVSNNLIYPFSFIATGLPAVACQHEMDHYYSTLFIDHVKLQSKAKVGPNDPCICGKSDPSTGKIKKFKKCCGRNL